jgi:hypothetical protein
MIRRDKDGCADGTEPGPFDAKQQDIQRTGGVQYEAKLAKVVETLKRSATDVETAAYEIAGAVETEFVARVMLAAAELEKLAAKTSALLEQMETNDAASLQARIRNLKQESGEG